MTTVVPLFWVGVLVCIGCLIGYIIGKTSIDYEMVQHKADQNALIKMYHILSDFQYRVRKYNTVSEVKADLDVTLGEIDRALNWGDSGESEQSS
tara:strand:+ start:1018 stop:1299 length:282 start_codon:yes stop_codon:yes gene_type:complete